MKQKLLHGIPIALGAAMLIVLAEPCLTFLIIGGACVFLGEASRVWAAGHLNRNREITTSGPYAYLRPKSIIGKDVKVNAIFN